MSTLAKIFVVFNLLLTVVFFGSSATLYMNRENWREAYMELAKRAEEDLNKIDEKFKAQRAQLIKVAEENAGLRTNRDNLATSNKELTSTIAALKQNVADAQQLVETHNETIQELNKTIQVKDTKITDKDTQILQLQEREQQARSDQQTAVQEATRLTLDYDKLREENSQTLIQRGTLQDQVDKYEITISNLVAAGIDPALYSVPQIDGVVEAVNSKDQLVVLSVGRDQKNIEGYNFFVHRGGEYIGKLKVIQVYDDLSGARVVYTSPGKAVQVGDRVTTTSQ